MGFARKKAVKAAVAGLAAGAMLLTAMPAYAGIGSGGGGVHGGGHVGPSGDILYLQDDSNYTDSPIQGWGQASIDYALQAMRNSGYKIPTSDSYAIVSRIKSSCTEAINQAVADKSDGDATQARVIGVAATIADSPDGLVPWGANPTDFRNRFDANWNALGDKSDELKGYDSTWVQKVHDKFTDQTTTTGNQYPTGVQVVCVAVNNQQPPHDYDLTVTTNHRQRTDLKVGSTTPIGDTLHASNNGSGIKENLNGTAVIHYEGQKNGYVAPKTVSKPIAFANSGDTQLDRLATPEDFGMGHWQEGRYWIDIQVSKQGRMRSAVDTADKDPSETWSVSAEPPTPPVKTIDEGVSADGMTNRTVIRYGTGKGGYEMTLKDRITADGVDYTVDDYRLVDTSDNGRDVSGEFTITWDKASDTVTAVRSADKGEMPLDHEIEFSFDVTVSRPKDFRKVKDHATGRWNQEAETDAGSKESDTWQPNPDKSWILERDGKWQAVIDPQETNRTGGDAHTYLDGDRVGSVVNGTIGKNLIQAPNKLVLTDDWTAADYLFDPDTKDIRVYESTAGTDRESSVSDIVNTGKDVTDQFDITLTGTSATATAKPAYLKTLKGLKSAKQITLLIPGETNFANGGGAGQVRKDMGVAEGDETTFCTAPDGKDLTNGGSETVNNQAVSTNEPKICGYVPPAGKDVVGEASQGGEQESVQGKVVFPGQKVEYQLATTPKLPSQLAYDVEQVVFTDTYDQYLVPDKQTLEVRDLETGKTISKKQYATKWDEKSHSFRLDFTAAYVKANWGKGQNPRVLVRFEGTVSEKAPTDHRVGNQWGLTLNNSLTPSNRVYNTPPELVPKKEDVSSKDKTVSIDGKTLLLGDTGNYVVTLDAKHLSKDSTAYKVQRLGIVDDFDDEYLDVDQTKIEVLDEKGQDATGKFNVQIKDGVAYVFAKTVDTEIPATGETVKGDPQPSDLREYSTRKLDAMTDPAIDQNLLGQEYQVIMPYKVSKVKDGYTVMNKAIQVTNDLSKETNEVSNPLKPINPKKDVTVKVGGESIDGKSVYLNRTFLYQLDSSILPAGRAYPQVDQWKIVDPLNTAYDQYTGQWAVYASRDLYRDGKVIAAKGDKLAGNGFDSSKFGGDLFDASADDKGVVTVEATEAYRKLVSADNDHENGWRAYIQCKRVKVGEKIENQFTEYLNDKVLPSNIVWTRTPDMTPSIDVQKWDRKSGWPNGDRDNSKDALTVSGDTEIVFTITNTSKTDPDTQQGAVYRTKDLKLEDSTIVGDGEVVDIKYPSDWDTRALKPGESVEVTGTLKGVTKTHTDRAKVTGTPLTECPVDTSAPFGDGTSDDASGSKPEAKTEGKSDDVVTIDGKDYCADTKVESATDDWNGMSVNLATTGSAVYGMAAAATALAAAGVAIAVARRRRKAVTAGAEHASDDAQ